MSDFLLGKKIISVSLDAERGIWIMIIPWQISKLYNFTNNKLKPAALYIEFQIYCYFT